jgi:hypothetical protein
MMMMMMMMMMTTNLHLVKGLQFKVFGDFHVLTLTYSAQ